MASPTLALSALVAAAAAVMFLYAGHRLGRRPVSDDARPAAVLFGVWWWSVAASSGANAVGAALAAVGVLHVEAHAALRLGSIGAGIVGAWGLVYYVLYLVTGRRILLAPVTALYVVILAAVLAVLVRAEPVGVAAGEWWVVVAFAEPVRGPLLAAVFTIVFVPPLVATAAYAALLRGTMDATQRYRVALVSVSLSVWFVSLLVARATESGLAIFLTRNVLALAVAVLVLAAYWPPAWVRRRLGVQRLAPAPAAAGRLG